MITEAELAEHRGDAESRMRSRVTVRRRTGRDDQDEGNGEEAPIWEIVHTRLRFRLTGSSHSDGGSHTVSIGGVTYEQATAVGHTPAGTGNLEDGDYIEITHGEWTGSVFSIVAATKGDQKTARRMPIAEQTRPTEWDS